MLGRLRIGLQGNFLHTDGYNIIRPNQRGPIDLDSGSEHNTFNGRLEYAPAPNLSLFLRGSHYDESRNNGTRFRISSADRGTIVGGGTLRTADDSDWRLTIFSHLSAYDQKFSDAPAERTFETPTQLQEVPSRDVGGAFTWTRRFFADHLLTGGTDFRLIKGESRDAFFNDPGTAIDDRRLSKGEQTFVGFFVQDVYTPIPRLQTVLGVRLDHFRNFNGSLADTPTGLATTVTRFPSQEQTITSSRVSIRYEVLQGLAVRGAGYRAFRAPTLAELYRRSSVESLVLRENPRLAPEFLDGGEVGFDYTGLPGLSARLTGYWNTLRDPISNVTTARDPLTGVDTERTRVNLGRARVRGFEVDLEYRLTVQWSVTAGYLFSEARLLESPRDRTLERRRLAQVPEDSATLGLRYTNPALFNLLVQWRYEGKKFEDADNKDKLAEYDVLNLTLSRPIPPLAFLPVFGGGEVFFTIQNAFDRTYLVDRGGGIFKIGTPFLTQGGVRLQF